MCSVIGASSLLCSCRARASDADGAEPAPAAPIDQLAMPATVSAGQVVMAAVMLCAAAATPPSSANPGAPLPVASSERAVP